MKSPQPSLSKTPALHGTLCLRLKLKGGSKVEYVNTAPVTFGELIVQLEQRIEDIRMFARGEL